MDAREELRQGNLNQALEQLKKDVRAAPRDAKLRIFLFQMFCITGEWDRAQTQLSVAGELDAGADTMVKAYRAAIRCEMLRDKVFRGERTPTVIGDPGEWIPLLIEANRLLAAGKHEDAARLRDAAFDAAPPSAGRLNGKDCEWIADADPRLGPVLEAIIDGRYVWVPYHRIKSIRFEPPMDLRDQVWMPANFTWSTDGEQVGFIPTRYPGTTASGDPKLLLARMTEWHDAAPDWSLPLGQRMLVTDEDETALMDARSLTINHGDPSEAASAETPDAETPADAPASAGPG